MEKIIITEYLTKGDDCFQWTIVSFVFLGAAAAYIVEKGFLNKAGEEKIKFGRSGFLYSLVGTLGGIIILSINEIGTAIISGIVGVSLIMYFAKQNSEGAANPSYKNTTMSEEEIKKQFNNNLKL